MKAIKRTVAALLATLMLATSTSFTLAAEEYTEDEAIVVAKVNAAGIMTGTDKGFEPSKSLTRAEAAAIIVRMKGISESAVKATAGATLFNDVAAAHWASGYVNQASNLGIVKGVSATEFAPDREVTIAEFTTMAVRALGAGQLVDSEGVWPTNYVNFANENGILDDVNAIYTATATRMQAATIVANTLETAMWEKVGVKSNGEIEWSNRNGKTILRNTLNIVKYLKAVVSDIDTKDSSCDVTTANDSLNDADVAENVSLATLKAAIKYDVWYDKDTKEIVGIWKSEEDDNTVVEFTGVSDVDTAHREITLKVNGEDKEYDYASGVNVKLNEDNSTITAIDGGKFFGTAVIADDEITHIYAENYNKFGVVKEIKNDTIRFESSSDVNGTTNVSSIDMEDDDLEFFVSKDGKDIKISDIEAGDAVYYYVVNGTKFHMIVKNDKVEGKVTSVAVNEKTIKVDGTKYKYETGLTFTPGQEIVAYLNYEGKIGMFEEVEGAAGDIAVVTSLRAAQNKYGDITVEVELTTLDGEKLEIKELDLDETYKKLAYNNASTFAGDILGAANTASVDADGVVTLSTKAVNYANSILGKAVKYTTTSKEVVLTQMVYGAVASAAVKVDTTKVDADKRLAVSTGSYVDSSAKVDGYKITDSTKVLAVKAGNENYEMKVNEIDYEALSTQTVKCVLANIDESNNTVGVVIFLADVNRTTEDSYAVVIDKSNIDDDDYNYEIAILTQEGKVEELKLATKLDAFVAGDVLAEVTVADGVLTDATKIAAGSDTIANDGFNDKYEIMEGFIVLNNGEASKLLVSNDKAAATSGYQYFDINEKAIYFTTDGSKYAAGKVSAIKTASNKESLQYTLTELADKKATYCRFFAVVDPDDANEYSIFAIEYGKEYDDINVASSFFRTVAATALDSVVLSKAATTATVKCPAGLDVVSVTYTDNDTSDTESAGDTIVVVYETQIGFVLNSTANAYNATLPATGYNFTSAVVSGNNLTVTYTFPA